MGLNRFAYAAWFICLGATSLAAVGLLDPRVGGLLTKSIELSAAASLVAIPLGCLFGAACWKTDIWGRPLAASLVLGQLFVPLALQAAAWMAAFGLTGWWTLARQGSTVAPPLLEGLPGAAWVHGMAAAPWVALLVGAALRNADRATEESALLVMPGWRVLLAVSLRAATPALAAGVLWVALCCSTEMVATDLMQVRTFAEEVSTQAVLGAFDPQPISPAPMRLSTRGLLLGAAALVLFGAGGLCLVGGVLVRAGDPAIEGSERGAWRAPLGGARPVVSAALWLLLLVPCVAPAASLAYQAGLVSQRTDLGEWNREWSAGQAVRIVALAPWRHAPELTRSLTLGAAVATAAVVIGAIAANGLRTAWAPGVALTIALCLFVPGSLVGVGIIRLMNHSWDSPWWWLTWCYDRGWLGPWLAHLVKAAPVAALVLWAPLASVPGSVIEAAQTDGAGPLRRLTRVLLPARRPAVAAAWLAAIAVSLGEVSATALLPGAQTLTLRIYGMLHSGVDDRLAGLCLFQLLMMVGLSLATVSLAGRGDRMPLSNRAPAHPHLAEQR